MSFETGERARDTQVSTKGVVLFEKLDSKITADSKSTLAEKGNEYIMNLVGKREKVE